MLRSGSTGAKRPEYGKRQVVARRHAPTNRRREARIDDRPFRRGHLDTAEDALVVGQARQQRAFQRIGRHGEGVGHRAVDGAIDLGASPRVIDENALALDLDGDVVGKRRLQPVGLECVRIGAVGQRGDGGPHGPLAAAEDLAGKRLEVVEAVLRHELAEAPLQEIEPRDLRPQVALGLVGRAHRRAQQLEEGAVGLALVHEFHDGDVEALLEHLARLHRAHLAADVGRMRGRGGKRDDAALAEDRLGHGDVVEVPRGDPGRIRHQHVIRPHVIEPDLLDERLHRHRQRADERGDALGILRERLPGRICQHAGKVVGLIHQRRERRAPQRLRRLVHRRDRPPPQDLQRDGVEGVVSLGWRGLRHRGPCSGSVAAQSMRGVSSRGLSPGSSHPLSPMHFGEGNTGQRAAPRCALQLAQRSRLRAGSAGTSSAMTCGVLDAMLFGSRRCQQRYCRPPSPRTGPRAPPRGSTRAPRRWPGRRRPGPQSARSGRRQSSRGSPGTPGSTRGACP